MFNEKTCQVALALIPGVGNILVKQLISYCGSAEAVFKSRKKQLSKIPGIGTVNASAILKANTFNTAEDILKNAEDQGISVHFYTEESYPKNLKPIYDAPAVIYYKGHAKLNNARTIAIVGTRRATWYGKEVVEKIVSDLSKHKPLIVSGLAYGIDIQAHKAALKVNIPTVGVLASGLDIIYPRFHRAIVNDMIASEGGLLSEYPLGVKPESHNFPARNRIIAGIADVLIIVEAAKKGGALITANIADSYNKDIFAVPGNITNKYSEGCNQLVSNHRANIFTDVASLERHMNWDLTEAATAVPEKSLQYDLRCSEEELKIVQVFNHEKSGILIDEISFKTQLPVNQVANLLLQLEFKGVIKALPGKKFKLI